MLCKKSYNVHQVLPTATPEQMQNYLVRAMRLWHGQEINVYCNGLNADYEGVLVQPWTELTELPEIILQSVIKDIVSGKMSLVLYNWVPNYKASVQDWDCAIAF